MATRPYLLGRIEQIRIDETHGYAVSVRLAGSGDVLDLLADEKGARGFRVGDEVVVTVHKASKRDDA